MTKNVHGPRLRRATPRDQDVTVGGDLKYRVASNLLLNATVNPDFGQVEADPSELNLGAFETFFDERRPFFVEGKGLFTFKRELRRRGGLQHRRGAVLLPPHRPLAAARRDVTATSRRPRRPGSSAPRKVTGRLPGGFSLGMLDAVTDDVAESGGHPGAHHQLRGRPRATRTSPAATPASASS